MTFPTRVLGAVILAVAVLMVTPGFGAATQAQDRVSSVPETPYMGWNTYYGVGGSFDERTIVSVALRIVVSPREIGLGTARRSRVENLWTGAVFRTAGLIGARVAAHSALLYRVQRPVRARRYG